MVREVRKPGEKLNAEDIRQVEMLLSKYEWGIWLYNQETAELEYTATQGGLKNPVGEPKTITLDGGLRLVLGFIKSQIRHYDPDIEKIQRMLGSYRQTWTMWVLSAGDIRDEWGKMYPDAPDLTEDQMDDVAMAFKKGFEDSQDNWSGTLREAIDEEIPKPEEVCSDG